MKVALVGTPNVGKSTLFNRLTGMKQHTVNAPGTTVSLANGHWKDIDLVDLPGFYSFATISPDEEVAAIALADVEARPDVVIMVIDGAHLTKSLYLLAQLKYYDIPVVIACTMMDVAARHGLRFSSDQLSKAVGGIPVQFVDARDSISAEGLYDVVKQVGNTPAKEAANLSSKQDYAKSSVLNHHEIASDNADVNFQWVADVEEELGLSKSDTRTKTDFLDAILLNSITGPIVFLFLMFVTFMIVTFASAPFVDLINNQLHDLIIDNVPDVNWFTSFLLHGVLDGVLTVVGFIPPMFFMFITISLMESSGILSRAAVVSDRLMRMIGLDGRALMPLILGYGCNLPAISATKIIPDSRLRRMTTMLIPFTLCSARLAVFTVLVLALFPAHAGIVMFGLYLASIVVIVLLGLLLKPFMARKACASPFIIALPPFQGVKVGLLFKSVAVKLWQFVQEAGKIIVIITVVLWLLESIPLPGAQNTTLDEAGQETTEPAGFAEVDDIHESVFGAIADGITPIFAPLGFGDWKISSALVTGFVAKEAFVGTLEQVYNIEVDEDSALDGGVGDENVSDEAASADDEGDGVEGSEITFSQAVASTIEDSSGGHSLPAAWSLLLFILLYTPCMATVVVAAKEFDIKLALKSLGLSLATAYILSLLIFQIGSLLV
jgi:ferrous iron transport protein B